MTKMFHRSNKAGFTLVELIVVIAILAILAGVAIPVYSNYTRKAHKAADLMLLDAVNQAFAAACVENKVNPGKLSDAELDISDISGDKCISGVKNISGIDAASISVGFDAEPVLGSLGFKGADVLYNDLAVTGGDIASSFDRYFAANKATPLKYFTKSSDFKFVNGVFVCKEDMEEAASGGILNSSYVWKNTAAAAAAYSISNYTNMGVTGLTGTVDNLAGALSDYPQLFRVTQTGAFKDTLDKLGIDMDTADNATKANAAVFFVADQVSRMNTNSVLEALQNENLGTGDGLDDYLTNLGGLTADDVTFLGTAIRYGVATSYVYSDYATAEEKAAFTATTPTNRAQAVGLIRDATQGDGYLAYICDTIQDADTGSLEDTDAFFKILNVVSENSDGFASIAGSNLFSNPEVVAKINEILGVSE